MQKCADCPQEGIDKGLVLSVDEAIEIAIEKVSECDDEAALPLFLFSTGGGTFCFVCLCKQKDTCVSCLEESTDMVRDTRCNKGPLVCKKCSLSAMSNHLYECLGDGCMTPGEFAQNEYEMDQMLEELDDEEDSQ